MRRALLLLTAVVALGVTGCPHDEVQDTITLFSQTVAPPARTATLVSTDVVHTVEMSQGVVLAIGCWDTCKGTCEGPIFTVSDETVADVRPVFRASATYPTWVIVAKSAGSATIQVANACATQTYTLTVTNDQP
jgi:hypothetical protein